MKPIKESVGWCTPGDLRKISRLASQVVLNRILPDGHGQERLRLAVRPPHPGMWVGHPPARQCIAGAGM